MNYGEGFSKAIRRFDEENGRDPNREFDDGAVHPRELLYAERLTAWVLALNPQASEPLRLAARSQHLCRWQIPRQSYELTRTGYLRWRSDLRAFHARKSAEILREVGYFDDVITRVQRLNLKRDLGNDPECQVLEDALCLVTLQYQLADLMAKTETDKMVSIIQKTWKKMSAGARQHALALPLTEAGRTLIEQALAGSAEPGR
jgi:hypothetical protein